MIILKCLIWALMIHSFSQPSRLSAMNNQSVDYEPSAELVEILNDINLDVSQPMDNEMLELKNVERNFARTHGYLAILKKEMLKHIPFKQQCLQNSTTGIRSLYIQDCNLISESDNNILHVWSLKKDGSFEFVKTMNGNTADRTNNSALCIQLNSQECAIGKRNGIIEIRCINANGTHTVKQTLKPDAGEIRVLTKIDDYSFASGTNKGTIQIWAQNKDSAYEYITRWQAYQSSITSIVVTKTGSIACASYGSMIKIGDFSLSLSLLECVLVRILRKHMFHHQRVMLSHDWVTIFNTLPEHMRFELCQTLNNQPLSFFNKNN